MSADGTATRVAVTGGAGFIGGNLIRHLRQERPDWEIVNVDAMTYAGSPATVDEFSRWERYRFVHADIRDRAAMTDALQGCRFVFNLAAESHVDRSIDGSGPFVLTNVLGTQVLLDVARQLDELERFVHISTDEVYGDLPLDQPELRFDEQSPIRPSSPYAASKAASDLLVQAAHRTFALPTVITRCSNNFGPYQYPEKVIPLFVINLMEGQSVPLYGDGLNVRDWIHVTDHCAALLSAAEKGGAGGVYNIGADNERSNLELTNMLVAAFGFGDEMIERVVDRPGHDRRYAIDATRAHEELGWRPARSAWPEALQETVAWYRDNEAWWGPIRENATQRRGVGV